MTCIVGITDGNEVIIGGDSAGVSGFDIVVRKDEKVFTTGEFIMGCTSSFRMIQLLRFSFSPEKIKEGQDIYEYMCTSFINSIRNCFKNGGFTEIDKNKESGGSFLVGFRGRLFHIGGDFQVAESLCGYNSVGCGESYAKGSLFTDKTKDNKQKVLNALSCAENFSGGVRGPFNIVQSKI